MREKDTKITPSIIDRLVDYEPKSQNEAPLSRSQSLEELKRSVRRDVEWLLNSRTQFDEIPDGLEEVHNSLAVYGLPDFVGKGAYDLDEQNNLIKDIENALLKFEPRFMNLKVTLKDLDKGERGIRFHIEASLRVEPTPEPIVFDTVLQVGSGDFEIEDTRTP